MSGAPSRVITDNSSLLLTSHERSLQVRIDELLYHAQTSKIHQNQLESRIRDDSARLQQISDQCMRLKAAIPEIQNQKSRVEVNLNQALEENSLLRRSLWLEQNRIAEAKSHSAALNYIKETLSNMTEALGPRNLIDARNEYWQSVLTESIQQRELISKLYSTIDARDCTVQGLTQALLNRGDFCDCSTPIDDEPSDLEVYSSKEEPTQS